MPLCLLPTFIDPPCAALIRLPMSFPGKDLVSHAKAPCCLASIWLWLSRGQCAQPHHRQPSRFVLVPARGQGWGQPGPSSWQERGQPVARSRCSRRQIDALNYLAREHEAAATATPCTGDMGPHSHLGMGPPHPVQMGWPGTHCRAAGTLHLPGGASGTPLGGGCRWHRAPHPPQHLSMLCWLCQAVPRWCHWHHLHCPLPGTQIPALWHHLAGSMGLGRLQRAEGPPVFSVVSAKLPRLRRALSHGHPHPRPQPLSQAFYKKCIIKTTPHHHSRPA